MSIIMRLVAATIVNLLCGVCLSVNAQVPPPPRLEPLPEAEAAGPRAPDKPSPSTSPAASAAPATRAERSVPRILGDRVIDGRRVVHVLNQNGAEYYIFEDLGDGNSAGKTAHDTRVRVPRWVIHRW
jgi:Protein of unknown function (DUF2782)